MVLINRFGHNFVQNYVEFNGGGRGNKSKANGVRGRPLQKYFPITNKFPLFVTFVHQGTQNTASLPYMRSMIASICMLSSQNSQRYVRHNIVLFFLMVSNGLYLCGKFVPASWRPRGFTKLHKSSKGGTGAQQPSDIEPQSSPVLPQTS